MHDRPRIALLGIMQGLYDAMLPGIAELQAGYAAEVAAALESVADVRVAAPIKEREVLILGRPGADESSLAGAIARVVTAYHAAGVVAYNMGLYLPPLSPDGEDWRRFPPIARIVDRGDPGNKTSDIGAMELYAASVIAADPFRLADALRI